MKKLTSISLLLIALACTLPTHAQRECGVEGALPFGVGEKLSYNLRYNWGFIWADAGYVQFSVGDTVVDDKKYYHFRGYGSSYSKWDWFYKVRSNYESWTDQQINPIKFVRKGKEGGNYYDREYWVDGASVKYKNNDKPENFYENNIELGACPFDVISAIYYTRTIDFTHVKEGEKIPLNLYLDGARFDSYLRFVGREKWIHPDTDVEYNCIVFSPYLIEGTVFSEGENMLVYVTDDANHIPVYIETDLVVGKGKVYLVDELDID